MRSPSLSLSGSAVLAFATALGGCQSLQTSENFLGVVTPYRVEVVQGNVITSEQAKQIRPGLTRAQTRDVLGSPLLADPFHTDRWDYVFTIRRQGVEPQQRRLTLYFNGELLDRFEGDPMPSEQEFVAQLDTRKRANGKVPQLEATPEQLDKLAPAKTAPSGPDAAAGLAPLPPTYPPLESR